MCPGLGVAHSDQPARHGYGKVHSVAAFIASGEVSKRFCALKDFVCKWYPSLEVEVPAALLLHVTRCSIFSTVQQF